MLYLQSIQESKFQDDKLTDVALKVNNILNQLEKHELLILVDVRNSYAYDKFTVNAALHPYY